MVLLFGISTSTFSQDFYIADSFRDALVKDGVDTDGDGYISKAEAHVVTSINVEREKLADLNGISEFINLKVLKCSYNYLSVLDLSDNVLLEEVQCFQNRLTSINVSGCTNLEELYCMQNKLTNIDVSHNSNLSKFQLYENKVSSIDLSNNPNLEYLACSKNELNELDVSSNTNLEYLACGGNNLSYIDVYYNTELTFFACGTNEYISTLDLSHCRKIETLDATNLPHLKTICVWSVSEAENNPSYLVDTGIEYVTDCALNFRGSNFKNKLKDLNLDKNNDGYITKSEVQDVKILNVNGDAFGKMNGIKLDNIDGIDGFVNLENLSMSYNNVKEMDISRNTKLKTLTCKNNGMTSLDISNNVDITSLSCTGNNLDKIYVWDIAYAEGNSSFSKDASATWAIHETLKNDFIDLFKVKMYPVPFRDFVIIESDSDADISIYSLLGLEVLKNIRIKRGYNRINIDLNPNIYIISIQSETNRIVRRIVIE